MDEAVQGQVKKATITARESNNSYEANHPIYYIQLDIEIRLSPDKEVPTWLLPTSPLRTVNISPL